MPSTQVPEVDTAVRSLTVMWDGSLVVAANNKGTCYVWRLLRGTQVSSFTQQRTYFKPYNRPSILSAVVNRLGT